MPISQMSDPGLIDRMNRMLAHDGRRLHRIGSRRAGPLGARYSVYDVATCEYVEDLPQNTDLSTIARALRSRGYKIIGRLP